MPQVLRQTSETPGSLHLLIVSLFSTHTQSLMMFTPFFIVVKLSVESAQVRDGGDGGDVLGPSVGPGVSILEEGDIVG